MVALSPWTLHLGRRMMCGNPDFGAPSWTCLAAEPGRLGFKPKRTIEDDDPRGLLKSGHDIAVKGAIRCVIKTLLSSTAYRTRSLR
jgi:hypothetical protein